MTGSLLMGGPRGIAAETRVGLAMAIERIVERVSAEISPEQVTFESFLRRMSWPRKRGGPVGECYAALNGHAWSELAWSCERCGYMGCVRDMLDHSRRKHSAESAYDVDATCVASSDPHPAAFNDLRTFRRMVRAEWCVQTRAANAIQRCWRRAIACPEYRMCRERLAREHVELVGSS